MWSTRVWAVVMQKTVILQKWHGTPFEIICSRHLLSVQSIYFFYPIKLLPNGTARLPYRAGRFGARTKSRRTITLQYFRCAIITLQFSPGAPLLHYNFYLALYYSTTILCDPTTRAGYPATRAPGLTTVNIFLLTLIK